jgi:uncharacterized protein YidB (DUF937 family)
VNDAPRARVLYKLNTVRSEVMADMHTLLASDTLDTLSRHTGMDRDDLLAGVSQHLPDLVDQLTPHGRVPTDEEASQMV